MRYFIFTLLLLYSCSSERNNSRLESLIVPPAQADKEYFQEGEFEEMNKQFAEMSKAVLSRPKDINSWLRIFDIYLFENRITGDHQFAEYIDAIAGELLIDDQISSKDRFNVLSYQSTAQLSLHEFEKGLSTAQTAMRLMPYNASIMGACIDAFVELGRYDEAVKAADRMIAMRPDLRSYSRVSYLRELFGDVDGAIEAMEQAVMSGIPGDEQTEWARVQLGKLYQQKGMADYAQQQFLMAKENRSNYIPAITAMAGLMLENDKVDEAKIILAEIPELVQNSEQIQTALKIALLEKDEQTMEKNMKKLEELFNSHSTSIVADRKSKYLVKSKLKQLQQDHELKQIALEKAKYLLEVKKKPEEAISFLQFEYQIRPNNIVVNKYLAMCYLMMDNKDLCKEHLVKAKATGWKDKELLLIDANCSDALTVN